MTTVGYGDMTPITIPGRMLGVLCMFSGIILMATCVMIIGGNFEQVHQSSLNDKARTSRIEESARVVIPNASGNSSNENRSSILFGLSTASPRMNRHQLYLTVGNLELRVSEIEDKLRTVTTTSLDAPLWLPTTDFNSWLKG